MTLNSSILSRNISRVFFTHHDYVKFLSLFSFLSKKKHTNTEAKLDLPYLCDPLNISEIEENIIKRDSNGNIKLVHELYKNCKNSSNDKKWKEFMDEALKIPNKTLVHREENKVIQIVGQEPADDKQYLEYSDICRRHNWCRTDHLGNVAGHRAYYLLGELAELELALIRLAVTTLLSRGFQLTSVPDILPGKDIENCGMSTRGERTQVYRLDERHGEDLCLSGTAEMALAAKLAKSRPSKSSLPQRLAAVSRCFRAETSSIAEERGIYRVHQFTKVEMFGVTEGGNFQHSQDLQNELLELQINFFKSLGLHFRVLDMASNELGNPTVRKLDLEAWLPGRRMWGELCSCSDCGDYQSRRHDICLAEDSESFVHTVNGTACAIPRTIIAIVETHQNKDGTVTLPEPLQDIMQRSVLGCRPLTMPTMRALKSREIRNNNK